MNEEKGSILISVQRKIHVLEVITYTYIREPFIYFFYIFSNKKYVFSYMTIKKLSRSRKLNTLEG